MPHPRILKVLKMTAAQWGGLPPETGAHVGPGVQTSNERTELKQKALAIIAEEDARAAADGGPVGVVSEAQLKRLENIEASIRGMANDINRRFDALETRAGTMERGYDVLQKQIAAHEEATAKKIDKHFADIEKRLGKLEK